MQKAIAPKRDPWSRRPQFAPKQMLKAESLNAGFDDELARQRLLNLALHGWGVVFGYGVEKHDRCHVVGCGLALDRHGRMLYIADCPITLEDIEGREPKAAGEFTLLVHYAERLDSAPSCGPCPSSEPQWRDQGVVFTLQAGCEPVEGGCPELPADECLTATEFVRRRVGSAPGVPGPSADLEQVCAQPGPMVSTECGTWCYDAEAGVPVACIEVCDLAEGSKDEPCLSICGVLTAETSVVRHVYRTPVLHELINCCDTDLARVESVSWQEWLEEGVEPAVSWVDFEARFVAADPDEGLSIRFSRPVKVSTLHPASVLLTVLTQERLADYWVSRRVPLEELRPIEENNGFASGVQLIPSSEWVFAEITGTRSDLDDGARFELTVRGQLLRDACGQTLDARPLDIDPGARCQERPGGDFLSLFEVGERPKSDESVLQ